MMSDLSENLFPGPRLHARGEWRLEPRADAFGQRPSLTSRERETEHARGSSFNFHAECHGASPLRR
jgi:hypothetical protein